MENHDEEAGAPTPAIPTPPGDTPAERFGALVTERARLAGYKLDAGAGGRAHLARDVGMSPSAVGRMLNGKTLPMPQQLEPIARAVKTPVRTLLVMAGVISETSWPTEAYSDVRSASEQTPTVSPEAAADAWGIREPGIRAMLLGTIQHAMSLQAEADNRTDGDDRGEAIARG
ncbi:helix-turn-helix domain-containing protein [Streptomyces kronopolitis]|uniref:helix-turn-helix domain-containing protein n=1 Tax=Streptomyces kronopolitis TaxID=1612435 RepID=UPI0034243952